MQGSKANWDHWKQMTIISLLVSNLLHLQLSHYQLPQTLASFYSSFRADGRVEEVRMRLLWQANMVQQQPLAEQILVVTIG